MTNQELQQYLYTNIPISSAIGIIVHKATNDEIVLGAPLNLNINHKKTAFGGSLHSSTTLCCWCLIYINLAQSLLIEHVEIVISKSEIKYLSPVTEDFKAECFLKDRQNFINFENMLMKKGKARIKLNAKIFQGSKLAVEYVGEFVAIRSATNKIS